MTDTITKFKIGDLVRLDQRVLDEGWKCPKGRFSNKTARVHSVNVNDCGGVRLTHNLAGYSWWNQDDLVGIEKL